MYKKIISICLIFLLILSFNYIVYGKNGYWQEQWEAWGDVDNIINTGYGNAAGNQDEAIESNLLSQDATELSKMGSDERLAYASLLNKVITDYGAASNKNTTTIKNQQSLFDKASEMKEKLYNSGNSDEKSKWDEIEENIGDAKKAEEAREEEQKLQDTGAVVSDEKAKEIAEAKKKATENSKKAKKTGPTIYTLPKNNNEKDASESLDEIITDGQDFVNAGKQNKIEASKLQSFSNIIYNILLSIGVVAAVITGAIIGIKLMTSGIEEKAEVKQLLVPYLVGCVVVFGGFAIWKIAVTVLQGIA